MIGISLGITSNGGASAFDFDQESGLWMWLKGDVVTTSGGKVSTWADQSGNGRDFVQAAADERPTTSTINGRACLNFDRAGGSGGGPQYLENTSFTGPSTTHSFHIMQALADTGAEQYGHWDFCSEGASGGAFYPFNGSIYEGFGSTLRKTIGDPAAALDSPRVYEIISSSSEYTVLLDGTQLFTTGTNVVGFPGTALIGKNDFGPGISGKMGDFVCYSAKKTGAARDKIIALLNTRWGTSST